MISKKGWIRIVEAFTTILFITGVLLVVMNNNIPSKQEITYLAYEAEYGILREVQLNNSLKSDLLGMGLPTEWENLGDTKQEIEEATPSNMICKAKLCSIGSDCVLNELISRDVYVQSLIITTNMTDYAPRNLKLFCWNK